MSKRRKRPNKPASIPSMRYERGVGVIHTWPDGTFYVVNDGGRLDPLRVPGDGNAGSSESEGDS